MIPEVYKSKGYDSNNRWHKACVILHEDVRPTSESVRTAGWVMGSDTNRFMAITESLLNDGYDVRIGARGAAMFPLLSTGDRLTIHRVKDYEKGELIVINRNGQLDCSRLVNIFEQDGITYYKTRGDASFYLDEAVTSDLILGKVIKIDRGNVSFPRRILLFIFPAMRFGSLNAAVISSLIKIKAVLSFTKGRISEEEPLKKKF